MDPSREASHLADVFEANFEKRRRAVEEWNRALDEGTFVPSRWTRLKWKVAARAGWGREDGRREVGLCLVRRSFLCKAHPGRRSSSSER